MGYANRTVTEKIGDVKQQTRYEFEDYKDLMNFEEKEHSLKTTNEQKEGKND